MSAQNAFCQLPELLWVLTVAISVQTSPAWCKWHLLPTEVLAGTAIGESCHLAKSSGALYASDLHVSTRCKYSPLAFVDESCARWRPEGEARRARWKEGNLAGKQNSFIKCLSTHLCCSEMCNMWIFFYCSFILYVNPQYFIYRFNDSRSFTV